MSTEIFDKARNLLAEIEAAAPSTKEAVEQFRIKYIGSKGLVKRLFGEMRHVANNERRSFGQLVNRV